MHSRSKPQSPTASAHSCHFRVVAQGDIHIIAGLVLCSRGLGRFFRLCRLLRARESAREEERETERERERERERRGKEELILSSEGILIRHGRPSVS